MTSEQQQEAFEAFNETVNMFGVADIENIKITYSFAEVYHLIQASEQSAIIAFKLELEKLLTNLHSGGNGRRLIISLIQKLDD